MKDLMNYMGYQWIAVDDGEMTVGLTEEQIGEFSKIESLDLPTEGTRVEPDEICGEIETDQGPINLYSPVSGEVIEVNDLLNEKPTLLMEDPTGDGWLFKIEADDASDLDDIDEEEEEEDFTEN